MDIGTQWSRLYLSFDILNLSEDRIYPDSESDTASIDQFLSSILV